MTNEILPMGNLPTLHANHASSNYNKNYLLQIITLLYKSLGLAFN